MKFLTFSPKPDGPPRPGILVEEKAVALPVNNLIELIEAGQAGLDLARSLAAQALHSSTGMDGRRAVWPLEEVTLHPPISNPKSFRDFYAFEEHVSTARANRGRQVPDEWYQFPVFYFSNPGAFYGPNDTIPYPRSSRALDYELEAACIIGRRGKDITPEDAMDYVFGFTILNDWSARDIQAEEMRVGLGPAKGKDFASSLGPWIVTPDELAAHAVGRPGVYDLRMTARVNDNDRSQGNWKAIYFSFGQIIERASANVTLYPGDVIGSGTVGSGCLLELTRGQGPWLRPGDTVVLEIEQIGLLRNHVSEYQD
ncbi:MAG: fumarylacetoacetate hydrolase family protein [Anaerolineales bacterium]|nr:fumarylacetoacetate hydrolase family protein [Anaerolineales bacterium]